MILQAKDLRFSYSKKGAPVLEGVSLSLHSGERLGLWAPSGRGKTTLCRLLAGYERPQKGEVLLDGKPLSAYAGPCPVQMVWQHPETVVDPLLPLGKTLAESGMPEQRLLDALHIREGWLTRYPGELSGGELQRVLLALALEPVPHILILDEPLSGVDIEGEHQLLEMLDELRTEYDLSILLSTHDFATLNQFADKVILLNKRILKVGPPDEVTASPEFYDTFHLRMGKGGM